MFNKKEKRTLLKAGRSGWKHRSLSDREDPGASLKIIPVTLENISLGACNLLADLLAYKSWVKHAAMDVQHLAELLRVLYGEDVGPDIWLKGRVGGLKINESIFKPPP